MKEWHYVLHGQIYGPLPEEGLREAISRGDITPETLVWNGDPGNAERGWVRADDTEVAALLNKPITPLPPAPDQFTFQARDEYASVQGDNWQKNEVVTLSNRYQPQHNYSIDDYSERRSFKKIGILITVVLIVVIGGAVSARAYLRSKYVNSIIQASRIILESGSEAEKMANFINEVWYNAIHEEWDSDTNPYTHELSESDKRNLENDKAGNYGSYALLKREGYSEKQIEYVYGSYVSFNIALLKYSLDDNTIQKRLMLESSQNSVKELMRSVQNPPSAYRDTYDTLSDLYDAYIKLIALATNPNGSLQSYSNEKNTVVSNFMSAYEKLETRIP
jgi:hypothetical protein